ncbi:hypothetical protein L0B52_06950 [Suttonella sp. R2A3]|uniref:hypothetical protein n=1 Tax=Suttonella sp. R2A3 TaxID=2908648 RepID=UPI001F2E5E43|nr:hypothetical protein [Suttonella sp. R2A3]UJF24074.1 hypothetical protein L0B52_06950 [Suttonella sp. R2A3]
MQLSKNLLFSIGILGMTTALPAHAHIVTPSHTCFEPNKPYQFDTQWQEDRFNSEVEDYLSCINRFIEEQQEAIANHKKAAQNAINEWDDFVRRKLD